MDNEVQLQKAAILVLKQTGDRTQLFLCREPRGKHRGQWVVPQGTARNGEDIKNCAVREGREEGGIIIDPARLTPIMVQRWQYAKDSTRIKVIKTYFAYLLRQGEELDNNGKRPLHSWATERQLTNLAACGNLRDADMSLMALRKARRNGNGETTGTGSSWRVSVTFAYAVEIGPRDIERLHEEGLRVFRRTRVRAAAHHAKAFTRVASR